MSDSDTENQFFGKDCPQGMVQIEFVGCDPKDKRSEYGWKPVKHAFIDAWIDGKHFRIDVGDFDDGRGGKRRGLHITTDSLDWVFEQNAINSIIIFFGESSCTK